jgi:predicted site-specific integrase-resolvase
VIAKLVTKKEIAARYSVHPKTVEKWADAGIIPIVKINRRCGQMRFGDGTPH